MTNSNHSYLEPLDSADNEITAECMVRILNIPEWLTHDLPADEAALLKALSGSTLPVLELDSYGYVWFASSDGTKWFCIRPTDTLVVK
jgi:hypothetical protein